MGGLYHKFVTADDLDPTLRTGTITLPLTDARELAAGTYINTAGIGGVLTADTTPTLTVVNGGSRLSWAAANVDAVAWQIFAPVDFDETADLVIHLTASMSNTNDTPVLGISFVEAMSNTDEGGNTAAVSGTTPTDKTVTIAGGELTGGNQWNIKITPAAHGTDILRIDAVWITYTRQ